jgi:type IV pilus assembly protein PilO
MNPKIEKLIKLPLYQRMLIILVACLLICAGFGWFLIYPSYTDYTSLIDKHAKVKEQLEKDQKIADDLPKFKAQYEKMKEMLDQALTELPNDREIPVLLTNIAALARDNGLEVLQFKPGNEAKHGFYADVPVTLKLQGTYHQVGKFFYDVGNLPRIVNLGNVNMGGAKFIDGMHKLTVDCLATTFRFLDDSKGAVKGTGKP